MLPVLAILLLAGGLVASATAPGATIKLASNATLANPPSSVIVSVDYSCMPSQFNFGSVSVDQSQSVGPASGSRIDVFGFGNFQPICDDKVHHADVVVSTFFGSGNFSTGSAGASAFVGSGAAFAQTTAELSIK